MFDRDGQTWGGKAQARTYHTFICVRMHHTLRNVQLFVVVVSELTAENTAKLQSLRSAFGLEGMLEFES